MNLRTAMPTTTAIIDDLRAAFGREDIDAQIKRGMQGIPGFWAREGGREVGTRLEDGEKFVTGDRMVIRVEAKP